jgi:3-hydroxybutyryl-CoA dehydrogenase
MIKTIGVCGAGTMGSGIAQVAAMGGFKTVLFDVDPAMVQRGLDAIGKNLEALVDRQKLDAGELQVILRRLSGTHRIEDCVTDFIIEAIVELPDTKTQLFRQLATVNSDSTIFASNTSSLSLDMLAGLIPRPERFIGMHFFNPAPQMRLVEVINTRHTAAGTTRTVLAVAEQMGKTAVLCKDAPGFIVNHVARPYYLEALRLAEAGIADFETIDTLMEASGFRMGPFRLMDLIGNDINYAVSCSVYEALGEPLRLRPSLLQQEKVQKGELGRKTRKGYYRYA